MSKTAPFVRLENWSLTPLQHMPYQPPEVEPKGLHGIVYGHPLFLQGDEVTTSEIVSVKANELGVTATTRNGTEYHLGAIDPEYEKAYPGALRRMVDSYQRNAKESA